MLSLPPIRSLTLGCPALSGQCVVSHPPGWEFFLALSLTMLFVVVLGIGAGWVITTLWPWNKR